jgi:hypothetical protein
MALVLDPVGSGLVRTLASPGGNVTGLSMMATELYPKRLQLLKEVNPQLTRVAVLWNPDHPFHVKAVEETSSDRALAFDQIEFCGHANAGALCARCLACHSRKGPGAICG